MEEAVEAVERGLSRRGRLPARTQNGELAGLLFVGQCYRGLSDTTVGSSAMGSAMRPFR